MRNVWAQRKWQIATNMCKTLEENTKTTWPTGKWPHVDVEKTQYDHREMQSNHKEKQIRNWPFVWLFKKKCWKWLDTGSGPGAPGVGWLWPPGHLSLSPPFSYQVLFSWGLLPNSCRAACAHTHMKTHWCEEKHTNIISLSMPTAFDAHPPLHTRAVGNSFKQTLVLWNSMPFFHPTPHLQKCNSRKDIAAGHFDDDELRDPSAVRFYVHWPFIYEKDLINDREAQSNLGQMHHIFCVNTHCLWGDVIDD